VIQQLLQLIIARLVAGLAGQVSTPATRITLGPIADPDLPSRPRWALQAGDLDLRQSTADDTSGQPRPVELRETIAVNAGTPAGPYPLAQQPLEGSVEMKVVYEPNLVTEYAETLLPGIDFTVNLAGPNFTVVKDISEADLLRVAYSYVGNVHLREFEQGFYIDLYSDGWAGIDQWLGLTSAIIQTQQALLLEQFNFLSPTNFSANGFVSGASLQKIKLLKFEPQPLMEGQALDDARIRVYFSVTGQMRLGQSLSGGFGIISSIHTRGQDGPGVNIVPNVG
jgi:hypothetical protein